MKFKFVIPKMKETFGELEFAGEKEEETQRKNGHTTVVSRTYSLYSTRQRADNIEVIVPGKAGEKKLEYEEPVELVNPWLRAEGRNVDGQGFADYILYADDIVAASQKK